MKRKFGLFSLFLAIAVMISVTAAADTAIGEKKAANSIDNVSCEYFSGTINADVDFGALSQEGILILAMYDENNNIVFMDSTPAQKDKLSYDFRFITDSFRADYTVKVFCWKNDNTMAPIAAAFTANVEKISINSGSQNGKNILYESQKTIRAGDDLLTDLPATLGAGWKYAGNGVYTHAAGGDGLLEFNISASDGELYLVTFTHDKPREGDVTVSLGDFDYIDTYNGQKDVSIALKCYGDSGALKFKVSPKTAATFSNISCRKISETGEFEMQPNTYNIYHDGSLSNNQSGFWNVAFGDSALKNNVNGSRDIAIGRNSLNALESGNRNVAIGTFALPVMKNGDRNVVIGADGAFRVQAATDCISLGYAALNNGASRSDDIAIGTQALYGTSNAKTSGNVGIGAYAGYKCSGKINVFIGKRAGYNVQNTTHNVFVGPSAGEAITDGWANTAIGANALTANKNLSKTVAVGFDAQPTKSSQVMLGGDYVAETVLKGDLIVRGSDGIYRQIVFNDDGSVSWTEAER